MIYDINEIGMKYLGKYQHIKHLLEDGQYYLIYDINDYLADRVKIRSFSFVKYGGDKKITIIFSYASSVHIDIKDRDLDELFTLSINGGLTSYFFEKDCIFSLNGYDIGRILMELV